MAAINVTPTEMKLEIRGMIMRQIGNVNQAVVIDRQGLGRTVINDWSLHDGTASDAKVIARFQGTNFNASTGDAKWYISSNLLIEDPRFKNSTLQVMGVFETKQWSIVGGTGEFTLARGVLDMKDRADLPGNGQRVMEVNITARYTPKQAI